MGFASQDPFIYCWPIGAALLGVSILNLCLESVCDELGGFS